MVRKRDVFLGRYGIIFPNAIDKEVSLGNLRIDTDRISASQYAALRALMEYEERSGVTCRPFADPVAEFSTVNHDCIIEKCKQIGGFRTDITSEEGQRFLVRTSVGELRKSLTELSGIPDIDPILAIRAGKDFRKTSYRFNPEWLLKCGYVPNANLPEIHKNEAKSFLNTGERGASNYSAPYGANKVSDCTIEIGKLSVDTVVLSNTQQVFLRTLKFKNGNPVSAAQLMPLFKNGGSVRSSLATPEQESRLMRLTAFRLNRNLQALSEISDIEPIESVDSTRKMMDREFRFNPVWLERIGATPPRPVPVTSRTGALENLPVLSPGAMSFARGRRAVRRGLAQGPRG